MKCLLSGCQVNSRSLGEEGNMEEPLLRQVCQPSELLRELIVSGELHQASNI